MAGDWIKLRVGLVNHPRVRRLAECLLEDEAFLEWSGLTYGLRDGLFPLPPKESMRYAALRVTRYVTVTALARFWGYANEHATEGFVAGVYREDIDEIVGVPGFARAVEAVGWGRFESGGGLHLPNFDEHNTSADKRLGGSAARQRRYRERKKREEQGAGTPDEGVTGDASRVTSRVTSQVTHREEKRREEDISPTDSPSHPTRARAGACEGRVGVWEGHSGEDGAGDEPAVPVGAKVSPYARAAIALREAGVRCTSQNPDLIAAVDAGVTPEHLVEIAAQYPGKPVRYVCVVALRELRERSAPESVRAVQGSPPPRPLAPSRQAQAIAGLLHPTPPDHEGRHGDEHPRLVHEGHR